MSGWFIIAGSIRNCMLPLGTGTRVSTILLHPRGASLQPHQLPTLLAPIHHRPPGPHHPPLPSTPIWAAASPPAPTCHPASNTSSSASSSTPSSEPSAANTTFRAPNPTSPSVTSASPSASQAWSTARRGSGLHPTSRAWKDH